MDAIKHILGKNVKVIKEDPSGLVALYKPEGVKSHPNKKGVDTQCLLLALYDEQAEAYLDEKGKPVFYLLHRLDSPTSGVLLGALNKPVADQVKGLFREKKIRKTYYALVKGPAHISGKLWTDRLQTHVENKKVRTETGYGHIAKTKVELVKQGQFALLKLEPITGLTHQLRVQCSQRGCPVLGDKTYGDFKFNRRYKEKVGIKRLMLHAARIEVPLNKKEAFIAEAPLLEVFK